MVLFTLLTIIQIISESFPVSSSGHVLLSLCIAHFNLKNIFYSEQLLSQTIVNFFLMTPTVIIVTLFFSRTWFKILFHWKRTWRIILRLIFFTGFVDIITALFFLFFRYFSITIPLYLGFGITGLVLFSLRFCSLSLPQTYTKSLACLLGIVQGISLLPGISRFAVVFTTLRWMRFSPKKSFVICWMVQWPLIFAASALSISTMILYPSLSFFITYQLIVCMFAASLLSLIGLYFVYYLIENNKLWWFSIYMIVLTLLSFFLC